MKNLKVIWAAVLLLFMLALGGCPDAAKQGGGGAAKQGESKEAPD